MRLPAETPPMSGRVAHAGGEADDLLLVEDGGHDDHVVGMGAPAVVRVVRKERVTLRHVLEAVELQQSLDRLRVGGHVSGMEGLAHEPPLPVQHAATEIVRLTDDGGVAGTEDGFLHLSDDAVQPCPEYFVGDGVNACHGSTSLGHVDDDVQVVVHQGALAGVDDGSRVQLINDGRAVEAVARSEQSAVEDGARHPALSTVEGRRRVRPRALRGRRYRRAPAA